MINEEIVFEKAISRLEEIAAALEKNDVSLDESLKLFEEGVRLGKFCELKLKDVEQKVTILKSLDINDETIKNINSKTNDKNENEDSSKDSDNSSLKNKKDKQIKKNIDEDDRDLF